MSKLFNLLSIFSVATLLALAAVGVYLVAVGRLGPAEFDAISSILRGQLPAAYVAAASPATSQPVEPAVPTSAPAADEARSNRNRERLSRLTLERAAADVAARQALLNQSLQQLITLQEDFERRKKQWTEQQQKLASSALDRGFQKELDYVSNLAPKIAKDHVIRTWKKQPADVVKLFTAIERGKGQKILEQFKSDDELTIVHELLEQLRLQNVNTFASAPGIRPGDQR